LAHGLRIENFFVDLRKNKRKLKPENGRITPYKRTIKESETTTMSSNQLQKTKKNTLAEWINSDTLKSQLGRALPKHADPDRMMRVIATAVQRVPALMECTQDSLFQCFMSCSQTGLEPDGRRAHIIPFKDRKTNTTVATFIIDYKGLVELVRRSGDVSDIHCDVVCENDEFAYNLGKIIEHRINFREPRGDVYAVYSMVTLKDGTVSSQVMTTEEVESVRARSKSSLSGPWVTDWAEMAKKTVFKRHSKWLPLSYDVRDLIEKDSQSEFGEREFRDVTPKKAKFTGMFDPPSPAQDEEPEGGVPLATGEDEPEPEPKKTGSTKSSKPRKTAKKIEPDQDDLPMEPEEPPVAEDKTAVEDLRNSCKEAGVPWEKMVEWAEGRKLDVDNEEDAQRILNAKSTVFKSLAVEF
jgi:recombination protein RecT